MSRSTEWSPFAGVHAGGFWESGFPAACAHSASTLLAAFAVFGAFAFVAAAANAAEVPSVMYRCPGNDYNNTLSAKEAKDRGCKTLEGAPITVIQSSKPRPVPNAGNGAAAGSIAGGAASRVDPAEQRARDSDARRILEVELQREQERLAQMRAEFNNGEPDRLGNEKNYQKYLDRVADMKTAIARKETDIAAIKREIQKLPS